MTLNPLVAAAAATLLPLTAAPSRGGILIDGRAPADGDRGRGWSFSGGELRLTGAEDVSLGGFATNGEVRICVEKPSSLVLSGLVLAAPDACALGIAPGASLALSVSGTNSISSGSEKAGVEVPAGASLRVSGCAEGAVLETRGGASAAGIGGTGGFGDGGSCGEVAVTDGVRLLAFGGSNGAGIGGGWGGDGGVLSVSRGATVIATGGWNAPGIGGGRDGRSGTTTVAQARVEACGGASAPGLAGRVRIEGGCVQARAGAGSDSTPDAVFPADGGDGLVLSSGTLFAAPDRVVGEASAPDGTPLSPFAIPLGTNSVAALEAAAGIDLFGAEPDESGTIVVWLPPNVTEIELGGTKFVLRKKTEPTGVSVNGTDAAAGAGPGWSWTEPDLRLSGQGPFALSGTNADGRVRLAVVATECALLLDGLSIDGSSGNAPALRVAPGSAARIELAGTNSLVSGKGCAGLQVERGASVRLAAATVLHGVGSGVLVAAGGRQGAGIGGGVRGDAGTVAVESGEILAAGGAEGAGIGGGSWGEGADVEIAGGFVRALAGTDAAAVGGGKFRPAGSFRMSGGTLVPDAQPECALVGGGAGAPNPSRGDTEITGGSLVAAAARVMPRPKRDGAAYTTRRGRQFERVALWRARADVGVTNAPVDVSELRDYGTADVRGGPAGEVVFWLPAGDHEFALPDGRAFAVHVGPDDPAKDEFRPTTGLRVNGIDLAAGGGHSWHWDGHRVEFNGPGPFVVSGRNAATGASLFVPGGNRTEIVASNLVCSAASGLPALEVGPGARVDVEVCGSCALQGGDGGASAVVGQGARLRLRKGRGGGALDVAAGKGAPSAFAPGESGRFGEVALGRGVEADRTPGPDAGPVVRFRAGR